MTRAQALADFQSALHVSHSQIFTYLGLFVEIPLPVRRAEVPAERVGIALPFGSAIHTAIERYYRTLKDTEGRSNPWRPSRRCSKTASPRILEKRDVPVVFKKETPDRECGHRDGQGACSKHSTRAST